MDVCCYTTHRQNETGNTDNINKCSNLSGDKRTTIGHGQFSLFATVNSQITDEVDRIDSTVILFLLVRTQV